MEIHLSEDLEQFVNDAVRAGFYDREDDVIRDALDRLKETLPPAGKAPARKSRTDRRIKPGRNPVTPEELNRRLLAAGLITPLPDPAEDLDDDEPPIEMKGEPLSETIIRERRRGGRLFLRFERTRQTSCEEETVS